MKKIRVLHLGQNNWNFDLTPEDKLLLNWTYIDTSEFKKEKLKKILKNKKTFDAVICSEAINNELLTFLSHQIEAYTMIVDEKIKTQLDKGIVSEKLPNFISFSSKRFIIDEVKQNFFSGQMGSKLHTNTIHVAPRFNGSHKILGEVKLILNGNYSELNKEPLLSWQQNIGLYGRSKKIWLEFNKDPSVQISLTLIKIREGGSEIIETCIYEEDAVKSGIEVPYENHLGYLSVLLTAHGEGTLEIGPLHFRDTRKNYGEYILGGEKIINEYNQEIYYYFNPGDLKPPLNVYFSGYRSAEGFEGFFMMKALGTPFLLITDPRLEGGSFYMGNLSLETGIVKVIEDSLQKLNFSTDQLILSGLSMGTFGALYYANQLSPSHVIVGKPLVNVGDIAKNEQLMRPGGFPTSLDILNSLTGTLQSRGVEILNQRFWKSFNKGKYENTQFIIAYMLHDDYDVNAYNNIIMNLSHTQASVISKGIPGRHNDNSLAINQWFVSQYKRVLREKFDRTKEILL